MRKFIFIAGFVLASAAAQAGDRSLSLGGGVETKSAPAPAKATGASKSAEAPQAAEAPRYVERPAVAEPETLKAETPKAEAPGAETNRAETSRAVTARSRAARMQAARMQRPAAGPGRPMARRTALMSRSGRPHNMRYGIKMRIISALHRHGIYW
jgi:hypothetical protein